MFGSAVDLAFNVMPSRAARLRGLGERFIPMARKPLLFNAKEFKIRRSERVPSSM